MSESFLKRVDREVRSDCEMYSNSLGKTAVNDIDAALEL